MNCTKERISFSIDVTLLSKLEAYARQDGFSLHQYIRDILRCYVESQEVPSPPPKA